VNPWPVELPDGLELVRTTPRFDNDSVPAGLLGSHQVAEGVWGRLVVHSGSLVFHAEADASTGGSWRVASGDTVVIPPGRPHHLVLDEPAEFVVEFHRPT
jgi:tellurite resistance-related uncharacterized protein